MSIKDARETASASLRRGDPVSVRSLDEILATLDADAKLEGLPFMPEMVPYCGKTFRVYRRAEKTCVEGVGVRSMKNTVFLDGLRCDGAAHGGCQRGCLFFWKEAWLREEGGGRKAEGGRDEIQLSNISNPQSLVPDSSVHHSSFIIHHSSQLPTTKADRFYCQSTELPGATFDLPPGKLGHYLHDLQLGEITLRRFGYMLWLAFTNRLWRMLHGRGFYQLTGQQKQTLSEELDLRPGELVEIKSPAEIEATLDAQGRNRGLSFEPEMAQHCGRRYRVATPVRAIIAEQTGKMVKLTNTVILEGLICQGICAKNCPRANFFYWRDIWLKRV